MGERFLMPDSTIKKVLLGEGASRYDLTRRILSRLPDTPVQQVASGDQKGGNAGEGRGKDRP